MKNTNSHRVHKKVQMGAAPYRGAPIRTCTKFGASTEWEKLPEFPLPDDQYPLLSAVNLACTIWGDSPRAVAELRRQMLAVSPEDRDGWIRLFQQAAEKEDVHG